MTTYNRFLFAVLLLAIILVFCLNCALKTHQDSITILIGHEPADARLQQLAAAIPSSALRVKP